MTPSEPPLLSILSDQPADEDQLNFSPCAKTLADIVADPGTDTPLLVISTRWMNTSKNAGFRAWVWASENEKTDWVLALCADILLFSRDVRAVAGGHYLKRVDRLSGLYSHHLIGPCPLGDCGARS